MLGFESFESSPMTSQYLSIKKVFFSICRLPEIPMSSCDIDPPIRPTPAFGELGWTYGVKSGTNQKVIPTFLFDFLHTIGQSSTV